MTEIHRREPQAVVVVSVIAVGTDGLVHDAKVALRAGLLEEDPRHADAVYGMLERHLEAQMREKGVWADAGEAGDQQ